MITQRQRSLCVDYAHAYGAKADWTALMEASGKETEISARAYLFIAKLFDPPKDLEIHEDA